MADPEDRVAELQSIMARRTELLEQMHHWLLLRDNVGVTGFFEQDEGTKDGVAEFLDKFDIQHKGLDGSIRNLSDAVPHPTLLDGDRGGDTRSRASIHSHASWASLPPTPGSSRMLESPSAPPTPRTRAGASSRPVESFMPPAMQSTSVGAVYSIPLPNDYATEQSDFDFSAALDEDAAAQPVFDGDPWAYRPQYTLPPLKSLPPEYSRRGKPGKQPKKRDRERDRGSKDDKADGKRDDGAFMGIQRWGATIKTNPAWKYVSRSQKALSSQDWTVASTELKITRVLERIEVLHNQGKWSFTQVKRAKRLGPGTKSHRDYLLDEMRWMRTDFREERKWKLAAAFQLAGAARAWHRYPDRSARVEAGICIPLGPPGARSPKRQRRDAAMDVDEQPQGSEEVEAEEMLAYAADGASDDEDSQDEQNESVEPSEGGYARETPTAMKIEDIDDMAVLVRTEGGDITMAEKTEDGSVVDFKMEDSLPVRGALKESSENPMMNEAPSADFSRTSSRARSHLPAYGPIRDRIINADDSLLFVDGDDLALVYGISQLSTEDNPEDGLPTPDLPTLFPELTPYGLLDIAPPTPPDGKKKSERKNDRDDPYKRTDDAAFTKVTPMSEFMYKKPTLIGPLQPALHWDGEEWHDLDTAPISLESETPMVRISDDSACSLFHPSKPVIPGPGSIVPNPFNNAEVRQQSVSLKRSADHLWNTGEDMLLRALCERYPGNWRLVCDSFNSSWTPAPLDKRSPWDCYERWRIRWGPSKEQAQGTPSEVGVPQSPALEGGASHMTTRGVKRLASVTAPRATTVMPVTTGDSSKKRRRHMAVFDTVRKAVKKRDATARSNAAQNKRNPSVHETHAPYNKLARMTAIELCKIKNDQDATDQRQRQMATEARIRQQQQMQMTPQQIQQVQQQAAMQQQLNAQRTAAAAAAPGVAQIRQQVNISQQQQRAGTPMSAAAANAATARMSPQQLAQAQARQILQLQAAAQGAGAAGPLAGANGLAAHLSPPYAARAASMGSPGMPQAVAAPNAASPQPAQAQAHLAAAAAAQAQAQVQAQAQGMQRVPVLPMQAGQAAVPTYQAFSQDMLQEYIQRALAANAANTVRGVQGQPQVPVPVQAQFPPPPQPPQS